MPARLPRVANHNAAGSATVPDLRSISPDPPSDTSPEPGFNTERGSDPALTTSTHAQESAMPRTARPEQPADVPAFDLAAELNDPTAASDPELDAINDDFVEPEEDDAESDRRVDVASLATAIVGAVNAAQGPRKMSHAEYIRERSEHRHKPNLGRKFYQNGILLTKRQLTEADIRLINLLRPGVYLGGMFSVVEVRDGDAHGRVPAFDLRYSNRTVEDRMQIKSEFGSLGAILRAILKEAGISPLAA
jgi:hypothetical protein